MYDADLFRCWTLDWVGTGLLHKQLSIYILVAVDRVKVSLKRKNERKKGKKNKPKHKSEYATKNHLGVRLTVHTCALALFVHAKLASATPPWRDASIHLEFVSGSAIDPSTTNRSTHAHTYVHTRWNGV